MLWTTHALRSAGTPPPLWRQSGVWDMFTSAPHFHPPKGSGRLKNHTLQPCFIVTGSLWGHDLTGQSRIPLVKRDDFLIYMKDSFHIYFYIYISIKQYFVLLSADYLYIFVMRFVYLVDSVVMNGYCHLDQRSLQWSTATVQRWNKRRSLTCISILPWGFGPFCPHDI